MSRLRLLLPLVLLLGGCQGQPPAAPVEPVAQAPSPQPAAAIHEGVARYFGEPMAGAEVKAYMVGAGTQVATSTTGADGKFVLTFGPEAPAGALVKLVVTGGGRTVSGLATVPARRVLQAGDGSDGSRVDEQSTLVVVILGPRLEELGKLTIGAQGSVNFSLTQEGLRLYGEALAAVHTGPPISRDAFEALKAEMTTDGAFNGNEGFLQKIAALVPQTAKDALRKIADSLGKTIIDQPGSTNKPLPGTGLNTGNVNVIDLVKNTGVSADNTATPRPPALSGQLAIEDGKVVDAPASAAFELAD